MFKKIKVCLSVLLCLSILLCGNVFASEPATAVGLDGSTSSNSLRAYTTGEVLITTVTVYPAYLENGLIKVNSSIYATKNFNLSSGSGLYIDILGKQSLMDRLAATGKKQYGWRTIVTYKVDSSNVVSWTHRKTIDGVAENDITETISSGATGTKSIFTDTPWVRSMTWSGYLTVRTSSGLATRTFSGGVGFTDR